MVPYIRVLVLMSIVIKVANGITNGHPVSGQKRYMVYLLQDKSAPNLYSSWMCGGAIIHHLYIITAASCVFDGQRVYVISGYNKYVNAEHMEKDVCIMQKRRKIVEHCFPTSFREPYLHNYDNYWNYGDITVAKVDVPFDFNDHSYYNVCSYPPAPIRVNYMQKFVEGDREVISLGWGHREFYRPEGYLVDLNEEYLRYSAGRITSRNECYLKWDFNYKLGRWAKALTYFLLCVDKPGHLDEFGVLQNKYEEIYVKCNDKQLERTGNHANISETECLKLAALRNEKEDDNATTGGFCQNDHGGPLVTWIGGVETVIAVATMFPITKEMRCRTPYLYSSTICFNKVIECLTESRMGRSRRAMDCGKILKDNTYVRNVWPNESGIVDDNHDVYENFLFENNN